MPGCTVARESDCIEAHDRAALERLLRYCAHPPFPMERLRKVGSDLVYRFAKQRSEPASDQCGTKAGELHLTPLELIARIATLVPTRAPTGTATLVCWHPTHRCWLQYSDGTEHSGATGGGAGRASQNGVGWARTWDLSL